MNSNRPTSYFPPPAQILIALLILCLNLCTFTASTTHASYNSSSNTTNPNDASSIINPQLAFRPMYSSSTAGKVGQLGANWSHNYESSINITRCGDVMVSAGDGGSMRFIPGSGVNAGKLIPAKGYHGTLIADQANKSFDFYSKDGTQYHFDFFVSFKGWRVTSITDTNGNKLKLKVNALDPNGLVTEIEDANKRIMSFVHESRTFDKTGITASVIVKVKAPEGVELNFSYDDFGNLVAIAREAGNIPSVETYTYSTGAGLLFAHNMVGFTNAISKTTDIEYDIGSTGFTPEGATVPISVPNATVKKLTAPDGGETKFAITPSTPSTTTSQTIVTDARSKPTTYTLNKYGNATSIVDPVGTTAMTWATADILMLTRTDANGTTTAYEYDPEGNITKETVTGNGAMVASSQTWLVQPIAPYIKNRVLSRTDRRGNTTAYFYDNNGNLTAENRPLNASFIHTYALNGDRVTSTDANGKITQIRYNALGLPEAIVNPMAGTTSMAYDNRGRVTTSTDAESRTSAFTYNNLDHLISHTDAIGGIKQTIYDAIGNKLKETDEAGRSTTYLYDAVNRLTTIINPLSSKTLTYDKTGNKLTETDWQGNITAYGYDDANRLITRTEPQNKITSHTYDSVGNLLTQKDANGNTTTYIYDNLNRRTITINAISGISKMAYDANSNPISTTDAASRTTTTTFDALNRATKVEAPLNATTQATYDPAGNVLTQTDANGKITTHKYDDLNRRTSTTNALDQISRTEYDKVGNITKTTDPKGKNQQWQYDLLNRRKIYQDQERNQTTYFYDAVGNKTTEILPTSGGSNIITHSYDPLNRRIASNDSLSALSSTDYDFNGNITAQTDANGNRTSHSYDQLNRKTGSNLPASRNMTYGYDANGNITSQSDTANGTGPTGNTTTHAYDKLNRRTSSTDALGTLTIITYDAVGNILTQTDPVGTLTTHTVDALNRRTSSTDSLGTLTTSTYDPVGNITSQTDPKGQTTATTYDALNRPTSVTHAGSPVSSTEYDEAGNVRFMTDALGNKTGYEYDGRHLNTAVNQSLAVITSKRYDSMGNLIYTADSENRTTVIDYDKRNRAVSTKIGNNETTTHTYDSNGNKLDITHPNGNKTTMAYDGANRLTSVTTPAAGTSTLTYDKNSNLTSRSNAAGASTTYGYDARNRRTSITTPAGTTGSATESFTFDANGNLKTWADANGTTIIHTYDIRNRLTNKSYTSSSNADGLSNISFSYDANGNITQSTETYAATPADTTVTPTLVGIAGGTRTHTKRYDSFNRLDKETDPWGNTLSHNYDAQGNLKATTATTVGGGGGGSTSRTATYQYDAINRRINTNAGGAATTITYDRSNLPTKISYGNGAVSSTDYDSAGRVTGITHTAGGAPVETTTYSYDSNGNRKTEAVTQHADTSGNNAQYPETRLTTYSYDADDRLTSTTASVVSLLSASGSITPAQVAAAAQAASRSYSVAYSYDAAGNRVSEVASNGSNPNAPSYSKTYTLNPRNQITQIVQTGGSGTASNYGATAQPTVNGGAGGNNAGNPTTGNQGTNTTITPPLLVQTNGTTTLQYDGNGNLTQKVFVPATGGAAPTGPPGSGVNAAPVATTTQYRWNVRDGLSLVSVAITGQPQSAVGQYRYTPEGLRDVKRAVNVAANGTTALVERRSLWRMGAGGKGAADFAYLDTDANNNLLGQYESHPNGRSALQRIDSTGSSTYLHTDALGSQTHTSNGAGGSGGAGAGQSGLLASTTQYDAFGTIVSQSGANNTSGNNSNPSTDSKFGYTGHEADAESGLVYFKARYYDPQLGRFIGADAFEGDVGNPMTWNGYSYARSNPLMYIDEDGNIEILAKASEVLKDAGEWLKGKTKGLDKDSFLSKVAAGTIGASRTVVALGETALDIANAAANTASLGLGKVGLNSQENVDAHTAELDRTFATGDQIATTLGTAEGRGKLYQSAKDTVGNALYGGNVDAIGDLSTAIFGAVSGPKGGSALSNSTKAGAAVVRDVGATAVAATVATAKDVASSAVAAGKNYLAARVVAKAFDALEQVAPSPAMLSEAQATTRAATKIAEGAPILLQEGGSIAMAAKPTWTQSVVAKVGTADEAVIRGVSHDSGMIDISAYVAKPKTRIGAGPNVTEIDPRSLIGRQAPSEMTGSKIKKYKKDMQKHGYDYSNPVEVVNVDGKLIIENGHHRTAAARTAPLKQIPITVRQPVSVEEASRLLSEAAEASLYRK